MSVVLQAEPFDPGALCNASLDGVTTAGAAVTFTGIVRSGADDPISSMTLEHYPALAHRQLSALRSQAIERFGLIEAHIIHRFGTLYPGDPIVQVTALAPHRQPAFDGASFIMDTLKTSAPFWKKEAYAGGESWVEAKSSDDAATARWT